MQGRAIVAGVELGGTKCVLTLGAGPGAVLARERLSTGAPADTLPAIAAVLAGWARAHAVAAVGIGAFGPLALGRADPAYGRVLATPKPGWTGADVLAVARPTGLRVAIGTDVEAAAAAEGRWGAARGLADHAYVTVGTGVGAGVVVGGRALRGAAHGEWGHLRLARAPGDGFAGACPFHGDCVEGLVSGPALARRFGRPGADVPDGDPAWDPAAHTLAMLVHALVLAAAPRRIALGGGVLAGRPALLAAVRARATDALAGYGAVPGFFDPARDVGPPGLGDEAGPLGPLALALDLLEGDAGAAAPDSARSLPRGNEAGMDPRDGG